jgi:hypothetical protein
MNRLNNLMTNAELPDQILARFPNWFVNIVGKIPWQAAVVVAVLTYSSVIAMTWWAFTL